MPRTLVVPGVSVEARFDVPPPLPARSGILGAVGIVDYVPDSGSVKGVSNTTELFEVFGPATRYAFPEAVSALVNGVSQVTLSAVDSGSGQAAEAMLSDDEGQAVVRLRARAPGPWGNNLGVRVVRTFASDGRTVRRVSLAVLHDGVTIERHDNLVMRPGDDNDLFTVLNRDSGVLVATDPTFDVDLPELDLDLVAFDDGGAVAASAQLTRAGAALIDISAADPGSAGNRLSIEVLDGRAAVALADGNGDASIRVLGAQVGAPAISIEVADDGAGGVDVTVTETGQPARAYNAITAIADLVQQLGGDPALLVTRLGDLLPASTGGPVGLAATRSVVLREEGVRTVDLRDLADADAIVAALDADAAITAALAGSGAELPDAGGPNQLYLAGGRDAGHLRQYAGQSNPGQPLLQLRPADPSTAALARMRISDGTAPNTVRITAGIQPPGENFVERESMDDLSMDPDSPRFLPAVLEVESSLLRAFDLYPRQGARSWPVATFSPRPLGGGRMPALGAWQAAIDALAQEDDVDMMIAGAQAWQDPDFDVIRVQQSMLGHARAQADAAKPRIVIGSVAPASSDDIDAIVDHAGQVAGRRFVLVAPSGADGAMAGLLGHLTYFFSPTFKTVAQPGVDLVAYSASELDKLVGANGNVCVITQKKGRGTICVKGIATDGFQISVTRVADRCIREVNAIANRFIGELNNAEQRNAMRQMIVATFTQMERDGALVPSVDGSSPAFEVEVYASQNDVAAGNARVDIAVRPVRAIDYVYATIRVRN